MDAKKLAQIKSIINFAEEKISEGNTQYLIWFFNPEKYGKNNLRFASCCGDKSAQRLLMENIWK